MPDFVDRARQAWERNERRTDVQLSISNDSGRFQMDTGTIQFADETTARWELVEAVPYEPAAYHWDQGIIVSVGENCYFISVGTGDVYAESDEDEGSLTRLIEGARCPEIDEEIKEFDKRMAMWEDA